MNEERVERERLAAIEKDKEVGRAKASEVIAQVSESIDRFRHEEIQLEPQHPWEGEDPQRRKERLDLERKEEDLKIERARIPFEEWKSEQQLNKEERDVRELLAKSVERKRRLDEFG